MWDNGIRQLSFIVQEGKAGGEEEERAKSNRGVCWGQWLNSAGLSEVCLFCPYLMLSLPSVYSFILLQQLKEKPRQVTYSEHVHLWKGKMWWNVHSWSMYTFGSDFSYALPHSAAGNSWPFNTTSQMWSFENILQGLLTYGAHLCLCGSFHSEKS